MYAIKSISLLVKLVERSIQQLGSQFNWSDARFNSSATSSIGRMFDSTAWLPVQLLGQAQDGVAQRIQGARGLAVQHLANLLDL